MENGSYVSQLFDFYTRSKKILFEDSVGWLYNTANSKSPIFDYPKLNHHKRVFDHYIVNYQEKLNIFIVGEGNFGKSSLINAIVKGEVAHVNFLPTTWCIHKYKSSQSKAVLYFEEEKEKHTTISQAEKYLGQEEEKSKNNKAYKSSLREIDWYFDEYPILKEFNIIDTPGLAQLRTILSDRSIEEYYYKADSVLWLLDAGRINSESTLKAIKQVSRFSKKIIGVLNKCDKLSPEAQKRALDEAYRTFGDYCVSIVPVSARNGFANRNNPAKYAESNIPKLLSEVKAKFQKNSTMNKNIQFYHTLKLNLSEACNVLNSEHDSLIRNYNTFNEGKELIGKTMKKTMTDTDCSSRKVYYDYYKGVYESIRQNATYKNAKFYVMETLLSQANINANIDQVYNKFSRIRNDDYYELIQKLSSKNYKDLEFGFDGSVISENDLANLEDIPDPVRYTKYNINIDLGITFFDKLFEGALEFFGLFSRTAREAAENDKKKLRNEIITKIETEAYRNWENVHKALNENITHTFDKLLFAFEEQFKIHFKSETSLQEEIRELRYKIDQTYIPDNFYVEQLLKTISEGNSR